MIVLNLTLPPSVNHLWTNVPGKGRVKTLAYKDWVNIAGWEIKSQCGGARTITGPYRMKVEMSAPMMDLDNAIKPVGDLLQTMNLVTNDRNMVRLEVVRGDGPRGVRIEVEAVQVDAIAA